MKQQTENSYIQELIGEDKNIDKLGIANKLSLILGREVKTKSGSKIVIKGNEVGVIDLNEEDIQNEARVFDHADLK